MIVNAVFQGGGVKGLALVGALEKVEEVGIRFQAVSGTSAGSIVAALYASGYSAAEMKAELEQTDISKLLDPFPFRRAFFLKNKGLYKGEKLYDWIYQLLAKKGVRTFSNLRDIDLKIIASDITHQELLTFDKSRNPTLNVAEAVRMSIGIPLFFKAYSYGERLMVDGGVLSNFPLFTFANDSNTLGFKIVSEELPTPKAPKGIIGLIWSLAETMMAAHDKLDEQERPINIIYIPDGGIPTVKFELSEDEKLKLYQNGYHAASKFLANSDEFFDSIRTNKLIITPPPRERIIVRMPVEVSPDESIRVSVSSLFRVQVDGKYLLVKGNRIDQFQPVGGVLKRFAGSKPIMRELGVLDDDKFPIDEGSRNDLRVRVPAQSLSKFLNWYATGKDREISPWREFYEELVQTELLPKEDFPFIQFEAIRTHIEGIRYSEHFQCHELLIAELYEVIPSQRQLDQLLYLQKTSSPKYLWADASMIQSRGYDSTSRNDVARISEHSSWIL